MDDYPDGNFFLLTNVKRLYHVGIPVKPFAYPCIHRIGGDVVRINADDVLDFCHDGAVWEKGTFYRNAEILKKNRGTVRSAFSMERDCLFHRIADCVSCLSKGGVARFLDRVDGVFVYPLAVFL